MENRFMEELASLIKKYKVESQSDTPDHILALFIWNSLRAYEQAICETEDWFDKEREKLPVKMANKKPVSRCPYMSCKHHYLDNWTGRCRLELAYISGQGACESYAREEIRVNARVPNWYKEVGSD